MQDRFRLVSGKTHLAIKIDRKHRLIYQINVIENITLSCTIIKKHVEISLAYMRHELNHICFFQHTRIRNYLHLLSNRPVTGMTGCAACRTMRMDGSALKMGVLFERSEFRPFSNDGHSQRNGSFGRPPFAMPKRFARNQRFRLSAYLDSFFFGGTKKNE